MDLIVKLMFQGTPPRVREGFKTETALWDFKRDCPRLDRQHENAWADFAKDVIGFHNAQGGILVFGIGDDFEFVGATTRLDSKLVMDRLRGYVGDRIWVDFHRCFILPDQRYLGIALIPPRGHTIARFLRDAPELGDNGRRFREGWTAVRTGDSTHVLDRSEAERFARQVAVPSLARVFSVDEAYFRVLNPDYLTFVDRPLHREQLERAMTDPRAAVASVLGIGGVGKTALATWAVLRAYERRDYPFIISISAKDRELTTAGILPLESALSSFDQLLDSILDVLEFPDQKGLATKEKEESVRGLLEGSNGLLFVDNLETVDDVRIIRFLDSLPQGVKAVVTSRRPKVRVSVHPVDVGPLSGHDEITRFVRSFQNHHGFAYTTDLSDAECVELGEACSGIPLAIRWALGRASSATQALRFGSEITATSRTGEELLEFCFRRIFDELPGHDKALLEVMSLFQQPISTEALIVGAALPASQVSDSIEGLVADALVNRYFDADQDANCYSLLPVTRAFVYAEVRKDPRKEERIRKLLSDWYEARDVRDPDERLVVREIRQGRGSGEEALLDLAVAAERRGDLDSAEHLLRQATTKSPKSWKAARRLAEFVRHKLGNKAESLQLYEVAARFAPRSGPERALIFREYGMLLRDSGRPEATDQAIECFEEGLRQTPNDRVAAHALAHMLSRKGQWHRVIEILEPFRSHADAETRAKVAALLLDAYRAVGDIVKVAELKRAAMDVS
ncbi:MAG TPA: NB-ARC domain-containing protein [Thermoanaerobaculia bacterium]|nr:NB-ARC domain-containing protein [Thermoanaerobaculia bacterium]